MPGNGERFAEVVPLARPRKMDERYASCFDATIRELEGWSAYLLSAALCMAINGVWSHRRDDLLRHHQLGLSLMDFCDCPDSQVRALIELSVKIDRTLERLTAE